MPGPELPERLDWAEALRYMGCFEAPDPATQALLESGQNLLFAAARPRGWWVKLPLEAAPPDLRLDSSDIQKHLEGCTGFVLLGVTLGAGVDALLRRLSVTDLAQAAVTDALASVLAERMAAQMESAARLKMEQENLYCTGRYSPGYGDWPLEAQAALCRLLDSQRRFGAGCSSTFLLTPRKTVTALMGVSPRPVKGHLAGCGHCALKDTCRYRKRGMTCADL